MFRSFAKKSTLTGLILVSAAAQPILAADDYKLGLVTFLSGGAAGPFGIPAQNAAKLVLETLNAGQLPAPYNTTGINGRTIVPVFMDEAGGATKQASEYRNLVERQGVDAVVGYISSGDCLAVPAVAEQLKTLTVLFDCGTPRVFEENDFKYVFRTGPTATMDNVAAAHYINETVEGLKSVSGINQNYSFGHESWADFNGSLNQLKAGVDVTTEQFPKIYAGQYGAEISALMVNSANVIHSSFWGGDMEAFLLQGSARGLFEDQTALLTTGESAMYRLSDQIPEGTILGGRGPFGVFAPDTALNRWFREAYTSEFGTPPTYPAYKMVQGILGLKLATEKAALNVNGQPSTEDVVSAFEYLEYEGPGGKVSMNRGKGHQATMEMVYGRYALQDGKPAVTDVRHYAAACVTPPEGMTSVSWIEKGMPDAQCD
ncbi:ABC transporter substrate-binding protein [Neptunomonas antarctica]|uniref:Amino acid/amide ABC transporter substrate-binding protein, HAAT family n=1 Tax=Neptunomonas antarctica TaxID=619304 RepID=A0A1N7L0D7_9GAMM|nr:ABC transporter substrate-binding protein [Neptunomonas antarctica]SIS67295.1 amino acid/amide ABC transporter substrate-binding protein, HAAT family [Neptunomonas antarctica]